MLSKVEDVNAITGLLKDFLRNLKEPLLTFRLNRTFMDAAGVCVCVCVWVVLEKKLNILIFCLLVCQYICFGVDEHARPPSANQIVFFVSFQRFLMMTTALL